MFILTFGAEDTIITANSTDGRTWDVLLFDCFTAQLDTKQMKAEEFGAVMGLAIGGEQTGKLDMLYALAEQGLVGTKPEVRPIP